MFTFVNDPQIKLWIDRTKISGRVSVMKQVEQRLGLIIEINPTGRKTVKTAIELEKK